VLNIRWIESEPSDGVRSAPPVINRAGYVFGAERTVLDCVRRFMEEARTTLTVTEPDLACEHCVSTVRRVMEKTNGVRTVTVEDDGQALEVTYDTELIDEGKLAETATRWTA
jgi:copper chaperone CopZ